MNDKGSPKAPIAEDVGRSRRDVFAALGIVSLTLVVLLVWFAALGWFAARMVAMVVS
ncbi:hypothetical protein [Aureimonas leprariae]|uniref:hypothetical protein n=1 Tax=Plantimonas leprariae TaxID=2615207 RepID=UPI001386ADAA|nr:hypothetical protein [Aureimonas leprariae]